MEWFLQMRSLGAKRKIVGPAWWIRECVPKKESSSGSPCGCPATGPSHPPLAGSETGRSASFSVTVFLAHVCSPSPPSPSPSPLLSPSPPHTLGCFCPKQVREKVLITVRKAAQGLQGQQLSWGSLKPTGFNITTEARGAHQEDENDAQRQTSR